MYLYLVHRAEDDDETTTTATMSSRDKSTGHWDSSTRRSNSAIGPLKIEIPYLSGSCKVIQNGYEEERSREASSSAE